MFQKFPPNVLSSVLDSTVNYGLKELTIYPEAENSNYKTHHCKNHKLNRIIQEVDKEFLAKFIMSYN